MGGASFHSANTKVWWTGGSLGAEAPSIDELAAGTDLTEFIVPNENVTQYQGIVQYDFQLYGYTHTMGETFRTTNRTAFDALVTRGALKPVPDEVARDEYEQRLHDQEREKELARIREHWLRAKRLH